MRARRISCCSLRLLSAALYVCVFGYGSPALAQLELGAALRQLSADGTPTLPRALLRSPNGRIPVLAEYDLDLGVSELLVAGRYRPLWLTADELAPFVREHPEVKLHWAPPRHTLLDEADDWIGGSAFRNETGLDGAGVVVGIVDTGLDVTHADLRDAAGRSRVRYLLDFSRPPGDRQPELEAEYGCTEDTECAIYSNDDLDEVLANDIVGDEPKDTFGHGTHVASLAAGNGLSSKTPRYIGVAPGATIFGARVSRSGDGSIFDADIVQAVRFIFEQAERLHMPAVVNLSLGSDFGTHDGTSPLEQARPSTAYRDSPPALDHAARLVSKDSGGGSEQLPLTSRGRSTVNVAPAPTALFTRTLPTNASTVCRTTQSPTPMPLYCSDTARSYRSKMRA